MKKTLEIIYSADEIKKMLESRRNAKIESIELGCTTVTIRLGLGGEDEKKDTTY